MTFQEAKLAFEALFNHALNDDQMRDFLLTVTLDESLPTSTIAAAAEVMRSHAIALPVADELRPNLVDIVGTGGDKSGSFNISTTTAILVASTGAFVAKHGNRSITSKSGSADVLEALGIRLDLSLEQTATMLEATGFTFMFAQNHHPAMKFIMPVRKNLGEKTVFNILGPLTNPAGVQRYLLGVFDKAFVPKLAEAVKTNGATRAIVVSSEEGMDEIGISGITYAAKLSGGSIVEYEIDPQAYGIPRAPFDAILGGDALVNAKILVNVLEGNAETAQQNVVLINAAASLDAAGLARDMQDGLQMAQEAIDSGAAKAKLVQIADVSAKL